MVSFGKIDMITKIHRALAARTTNVDRPVREATVYRIERVPTADRYRIIYSIEIPRALEVSGILLQADFANTMGFINQQLKDDLRFYQGATIHEVLSGLQEEIEIEVSL